jgi:OmpA-OmpF porin, OOP family
MKSAVLAAVLVGASAMALPAAAQMNMNSPYVGASIGRADYRTADQTDTAWRLFGGYQFHPNFSAELGLHHLGEVSQGGGTRDAMLWEAVGVGAFPVANALSVYGKLGAYYGKSEFRSSLAGSGDDTNGGLTYGFGAQYDVARNIGVRLEWQRYDQVGGSRSGETDIDVLNLGVVYRFR